MNHAIINNSVESSACTNQEPFALMVLGDDMSPEFLHGSILSIDPGHPLINGAFVVAQIEENIYFRQYKKSRHGVYLQALKNHIKIALMDRFTIKGVVVQSYHQGMIRHYNYPNANIVQCYEKNRRQPKQSKSYQLTNL